MRFKLLKTKQKSQNKQEKSHGRSMVEMLGVLAIIGVLSIGGIAGYTLAMRKYRANELMNLVLKYATMNYTSCVQARLDGFKGEKDDDVYLDSTGNEIQWFSCPLSIPFTSAGLGGLPQGVKKIMLWNAITISTKSADIVGGEILFSDKNLCKTVTSAFQSVRGSEYTSCDYEDASIFSFFFYMK